MLHLPHRAYVEGRAVIVSAKRRWGLKDLLKEVRDLAEEISQLSPQGAEAGH